MKMDEYLEKRKKQEDESLGKLRELEEAERKAKEIKESFRAERRLKSKQRMENFSLLGMHFRPWTLNDISIVLFFIAILAVGSLTLMPGNGEFSDTSDDGFFAKLFKGISGSSTTETNVAVPDEAADIIEELVPVEEVVEEVVEEEIAREIDFLVEPQYEGELFTTINATGQDVIWYNLYLVNSNSFNLKCSVDHFVNAELKDQSSINVLSYDERSIAIRETSSAVVDGLAKVKLDVKCYDEADINSETTKTFNLKFYFS